MQRTLIFLGFLIGVWSHSWLECTDYGAEITSSTTFDASQCNGFARDWANRGANAYRFGVDTLPAQFNRPNDNNGRVCFTSRGDSDNYNSNYPMATYRKGETVRLVWPAKNHGGPPSDSTCSETTNDRGTFILARCDNSDTDYTFEQIEDHEGLVVDMKIEGSQDNDWGTSSANGLGFKQCVNYCDDTDLAVCFNDFLVPDSLPEGEVCTFYWYWSSGRQYTICWEAYIEEAEQTEPTDSGLSNSVAVTDYIEEIPTTGSFDVNVDYTLSSGDSEKYLLVSIYTPAPEYAYHGKGVVNIGTTTSGSITVTVKVDNELSDGQAVQLKAWIVDVSAYDSNPSTAYQSQYVFQRVDVTAENDPVNIPEVNSVEMTVYPSPLPSDGSFTVIVNYGVNTIENEKSLLVSVFDAQHRLYGVGRVDIGTDATGTVSVDVDNIKEMDDGQEVNIKVWIVDTDVYEADSGSAWRQQLVFKRYYVVASASSDDVSTASEERTDEDVSESSAALSIGVASAIVALGGIAAVVSYRKRKKVNNEALDQTMLYKGHVEL